MISVCMATYNGAAFIEVQLQSILCQLGTADEVILVDDNSSDSTLDMVNGLADGRIEVYRNDRNMGAVRTFERAINLSSGDVVFLSDQDDIWYPDKVNRVSKFFAQHLDVTLVLSDASIIDDKGNLSNTSYFEGRGAFKPGMLSNIIKNKYLGCTMAFRRSLVDKFIPFPPDIPMHDIWIGQINAVYGKAHFIESPLVGYRRHQNNASPEKHQNLRQMLIWRWRLVKNLCLRIKAERRKR